MNLEQTLAQRGIISSSRSKEYTMTMVIAEGEEEAAILASFGMANDSFHFAVLDIVPPKQTVPVNNPDSAQDKKERKSKAYLKFEKERQLAQDPGPRRTLVQTVAVDNSDAMDSTRSGWFV